MMPILHVQMSYTYTRYNFMLTPDIPGFQKCDAPESKEQEKKM